MDRLGRLAVKIVDSPIAIFYVASQDAEVNAYTRIFSQIDFKSVKELTDSEIDSPELSKENFRCAC